jgi:hypothetical protein
MRRFHPSIEEFESRLMPTLVFIFNGNGYAEAKPDALHTQLAALHLNSLGDRPVQMTTPAMSSPSAFYELADEIHAISKGRPIGLMGFSAGGGLALRLAGVSSLNVQAVMSYYGPPDLSDWLSYHKGDRYSQWVTSHVQLDPGIVNLLSGVSDSDAYIVSAFGLNDHNVVASVSTAAFDHDFPDGHVYYYDGPHGVSIYADYPAFEEFVSHLS